MQNPKNLLAAVVAAFEQWRLNRSNPTQKTPPQLQQQTIALLEHFSSSEIMKSLNISGANLKRWTEQVQNQHQATQFVALPFAEQPTVAQLNLEVAFGNGCQLRLCGDISTAHLAVLTQNIFMHQGEQPNDPSNG